MKIIKQKKTPATNKGFAIVGRNCKVQQLCDMLNRHSVQINGEQKPNELIL